MEETKRDAAPGRNVTLKHGDPCVNILTTPNGVELKALGYTRPLLKLSPPEVVATTSSKPPNAETLS